MVRFFHFFSYINYIYIRLLLLLGLWIYEFPRFSKCFPQPINQAALKGGRFSGFWKDCLSFPQCIHVCKKLSSYGKPLEKYLIMWIILKNRAFRQFYSQFRGGVAGEQDKYNSGFQKSKPGHDFGGRRYTV